MGRNIYRKRDQHLLLTVKPGTTAEQWHANGKQPGFWQRIARALGRPCRSAAG